MNDTMVRVIEKFVSASDDEHALEDVDEIEQAIFDNHITKVPKLLKSVMQRCSKLIMVCIWQGKYKKCAELFSARRTDNGFCCSFNAIRMNEQL